MVTEVTNFVPMETLMLYFILGVGVGFALGRVRNIAKWVAAIKAKL